MCCGGVINAQAVGLNPNICFDCDSLMENEVPCPKAAEPQTAVKTNQQVEPFDRSSQHGMLGTRQGVLEPSTLDGRFQRDSE
jgi:hypothetical protein